jgi:hypothetical protein
MKTKAECTGERGKKGAADEEKPKKKSQKRKAKKEKPKKKSQKRKAKKEKPKKKSQKRKAKKGRIIFQMNFFQEKPKKEVEDKLQQN